MQKNIYVILLTFINSISTYSQVGINTSMIQDGVTLQIESSNKGVLFPRIALTSRTSTSPLASSIPTGTIVFNTVTSGSFPNIISPGLQWWSAEDRQWTNFNTNLENVVLKYTNTESSTNYNTLTWQNIKLFGNKIINESSSVYNVNTTNQEVTINNYGLYSISALLSFDRLAGGNDGRVSLTAGVFVNGKLAGTEQVINPDFTSSIAADRGLFSYSFTEYIVLNDGDIACVKIKKTDGIYSGSYGSADIRFKQSGDSSVAILRIR
ncbi:hypothetical protein [Chryseobacterium sp.]|uniref:hypothetical protein n=1 Tax=Chryseobacterium sp. TaxID=1871047 RepID=UPI00289CFA17|nr:hypothetical protein [Chryseobacterium sp.]